MRCEPDTRISLLKSIPIPLPPSNPPFSTLSPTPPPIPLSQPYLQTPPNPPKPVIPTTTLLLVPYPNPSPYFLFPQRTPSRAMFAGRESVGRQRRVWPSGRREGEKEGGLRCVFLGYVCADSARVKQDLDYSHEVFLVRL